MACDGIALELLGKSRPDTGPAPDRAQQFANPIAVLPDFFLQLTSIAYQMTHVLGFCRRDAYRVEPVAFAAQPATQTRHQTYRVEPVGLGTSRLALNRDARRVDDDDFISLFL